MTTKKNTSTTKREQIFTNERILRILDILDADVQKGDGATLQWQQTDEMDAYQVGIDDYNIRVIFINDSFSQDMYTLMVYRDGKYVDSISNTRLSEKGRKSLARIYEYARRTALEIDDALDDVLEKLSNLAKPKNT